MIEIKKDKERGDLIPIYPLEFGLNPIKRVMIFRNVPEGSSRGNHGHRREKQLFYVTQGSISIKVETREGTDERILNSNDYINILPFSWTNFTFLEKNTELIVFGTEEYDEDEYIRDYDEFKSLIK